MSDEQWQPARLIPTSGISGPDEQETRATSALLAVLPIVREFGLGLFRPFGAPSGSMETYIEVPLKTADGRTIRPDGLVRISRGQRSWSALIEVKTGPNDLGREQIENYLDVARDNGFDAVVTISNQLAPSAGVHPVDVDKRKVRKVALHHLSWAEVVSAAVIQRVHAGVSDPEQAWILAELIRYLQHPRSGALDFSDMGASWVSVRESISAGTLRPNDKGLPEVVSRWDQLLRFAALRLERELGSGVQVVLSRKEAADPAARTATLAADLASRGVLTGVIRVPNTAGDLAIEADLRTNRCTISVEVAAPGEGRPLTRINWLVRQLTDAPAALRVDAFAHMARTSTSELLSAVRTDPTILLPDPRVDLRRFRVSAVSQLGHKRGVGRGSFIDSLLGSLDGFYESVLQALRPWTPKAPQLPKSRSVLVDAGIDTTVLPEEAGSSDLEEVTDGLEPDVHTVAEASTSGDDDHERPDEEVTHDAKAEHDDVPLVSWAQEIADVQATAASPWVPDGFGADDRD
ncbi:MAG: stress response protein [Actinobacteria bacterium]|uniref:Unannotated protein n=1 Tax=freshwater metagenome TaxID=449393 RepID=A0A6J6F8N9_9ZZZZ|nr:stress response protein [Actinomycetota bacterium]